MDDRTRCRQLRDAQWWPTRQAPLESHEREVGDEVRLPCLDAACDGYMVHLAEETRLRACGAFVHECDKCDDLRMIREDAYPYQLECEE